MNGLEGRPHWGKLHTRTAADLAPSYPRWAEFQALRDRLDPDPGLVAEHQQVAAEELVPAAHALVERGRAHADAGGDRSHGEACQPRLLEDGLRGLDDLSLGRAHLAEGDVGADAVAEQIDVLPDIAGLRAQRMSRHAGDRLAVDQDRAVIDLVEPQQQRQRQVE